MPVMFNQMTIPFYLIFSLTLFPEKVLSLYRKRALLKTSILARDNTQYQSIYGELEQISDYSIDTLNEEISDIFFTRHLEQTSLSLSMSYKPTDSLSSFLPSSFPSFVPTQSPSVPPSLAPTSIPVAVPEPSMAPSLSPSMIETDLPSEFPSSTPLSTSVSKASLCNGVNVNTFEKGLDETITFYYSAELTSNGVSFLDDVKKNVEKHVLQHMCGTKRSLFTMNQVNRRKLEFYGIKTNGSDEIQSDNCFITSSEADFCYIIKSNINIAVDEEENFYRVKNQTLSNIQKFIEDDSTIQTENTTIVKLTYLGTVEPTKLGFQVKSQDKKADVKSVKYFHFISLGLAGLGTILLYTAYRIKMRTMNQEAIRQHQANPFDNESIGEEFNSNESLHHMAVAFDGKCNDETANEKQSSKTNLDETMVDVPLEII